jgi:hypothetical protein
VGLSDERGLTYPQNRVAASLALSMRRRSTWFLPSTAKCLISLNVHFCCESGQPKRKARQIKDSDRLLHGCPQSYPQASWTASKAMTNQRLTAVPSRALELLTVTLSSGL